MNPVHPRYRYATAVAQMLLREFYQRVPIDIVAIASQLNLPIRERDLRGQRGTIARDGSHYAIVLDSSHRWHSEGERRWVIAEELSHAVLEHPAIVAGALGQQSWMREAHIDAMEREAKAMAADLLMPAAKVKVWFYHHRWERGLNNEPLRERSIEETIQTLADLFKVTKTAMSYRLESLRLVAPREER